MNFSAIVADTAQFWNTYQTKICRKTAVLNSSSFVYENGGYLRINPEFLVATL